MPIMIISGRRGFMAITIISRAWSRPRLGALLAYGVVIEMLPEGAVSRSNKLKRLVPSIQRFGAGERGIARRVLKGLPPITIEDQHDVVAIRLEYLLNDIKGSWARLCPGEMPVA